MPVVTFEVEKYDVRLGREIRGFKGARAFAQIILSSPADDQGKSKLLHIYFLTPESPVEEEDWYDPNPVAGVSEQGAMFVPFQLYAWYMHFLQNVEQVKVVLTTDSPRRHSVTSKMPYAFSPGWGNL